MRRRFAIAAILLVVGAAPLAAHDLFLKLDSFFVAANADVRVRVLNGTFTTSENGISRSRIADLTLVRPDSVVRLDTAAWDSLATSSRLRLRTTQPGTYVVGASTRPRDFALEAKEFNAYLKEEGILDVLEARRTGGALDRKARERYSKHVKALFQVGRQMSPTFGRVLGYPAEIVPLANPYELRVGDVLRVRCLVDGQPIVSQVVLAGGRTPGGTRIRALTTRTDLAGVATVPLPSRGTWYVKFINMRPSTGDATIDYESKWATLTFQLR